MQYINTTYRRTCTLWGSRYKSSLIQADTCLPACQRYIELNLLCAARVEDPAHYRWTSYRANALGQANLLFRPRRRGRARWGFESVRSPVTRMPPCCSACRLSWLFTLLAFKRRSRRRDSTAYGSAAGRGLLA